MKNSRLLTYCLCILSVLILPLAFVACETGSSSGGGGSGALFSDNFDGSDSTWLNDWFYTGGTNFTSNYVIFHETGAHGSPKCMNLYGGYADTNVYAYRSVAATPIYPSTISFYMKSGYTTEDCGDVRSVSGTSYYGIWCYFGSDGYIHLNCYADDYAIQTYSADTWYHIEFRNIDWTTYHNFDFYIDGVAKRAGEGLLSVSATNVQYIIFGNYEYSDFYIDEIVMK